MSFTSSLSARCGLRTPATSTIAGFAFIAVLSSAASAQESPYRFEALKLNPLVENQTGTPKAINNHRVIAGTSNTTGATVTSAVVWTVTTRYGIAGLTPGAKSLDPFDLTLLSAACDRATGCDGIAEDINDNDIVVGSQLVSETSGTQFWSAQRAHVWHLPTLDQPGGLVFDVLLPPVPGTLLELTASFATAVSSLPPYVVAGNSSTGFDCIGAPDPLTATRWNEASFPNGIVLPEDQLQSLVRDMNGAEPPLFVGRVDANCGALFECPQEGDFQAVAWVPDEIEPIVLTRTAIPAQGGSYTDSDAHGTNNASMIVGSATEAITVIIKPGLEDTRCLTQATFWDGPLAMAFVNLGAVYDPTRTIGSIARKIAEPTADGTIRVVGSTIATGPETTVGLLWECLACDTISEQLDPARWTVTELSSVTNWLCGATITDAVDINDDGWIVGLMQGAASEGVLLRPTCVCPGDADRSAHVDALDIAILFGEWGPVSCNTSSDFNFDGIVDADDLSAILGNWNQTCSSCN